MCFASILYNTFLGAVSPKFIICFQVNSVMIRLVSHRIVAVFKEAVYIAHTHTHTHVLLFVLLFSSS